MGPPVHYPNLQPTSVMDALAQATTRIAKPGQHPPLYMREQRLTLMQAMRLLTVGGAYGIFAEDDLGTFSPGKMADFVVLSEDPRDVHLRALEGVDVALVFVGGRSRFALPATGLTVLHPPDRGSVHDSASRDGQGPPASQLFFDIDNPDDVAR